LGEEDYQSTTRTKLLTAREQTAVNAHKQRRRLDTLDAFHLATGNRHTHRVVKRSVEAHEEVLGGKEGERRDHSCEKSPTKEALDVETALTSKEDPMQDER
jgi:hypothetical protein